MNIKNINLGWKFYKVHKEGMELTDCSYVGVNLPHTWNKLDGQDGGADYYRGVCYYSKVIDLNKKPDKDYYIEFEGVNMVAKLYINNVLVGEHKGGFSTFRFNITDKINAGENTFIVEVNNLDEGLVYPQTADFTFFGGIYRDVNLIEVNKERFDLDYFGSQAVMVTPKVVENHAEVEAVAYLTNPSDASKLVFEVKDPNNNVILTKEINAKDNRIQFNIENPLLWDGVKAPNLYHLNVKLINNEEVLDERNVTFGVRSFSVDKDGFYLNGRKYSLHGVSRHQDRLNKGWAISKADHKEDMELIQEIGATTIRLAHYQHDQYFYDLCDEAGMVVWAEIPYISVHLPNADENAISQMRELVIQNYNHPSIMFWGLSNEITIGGESEAQYNLHVTLNKLVKELDSTRLTTMAAVSMCDTHSKLLNIPDIFSYNHYFGWYIGDVNQNATWLDDFRKEFPDRPLGLSEYGCEAVLKLHAGNPVCGDYSEEYQCVYHQRMLEIFDERPWLWSTHVWNMFDFAVDSRDEGGVQGRNNKGLITYDRKTKKDSFYLYKAWWSDEPFIHIASKRFIKRFGKEMTLRVYTNQDEVSLYKGNKLIETKKGSHVFEFKVPLKLFGAKWTVKSNELSDTAKFQRVLIPHKAYRLKKPKLVANWFEKDGKRYEFEYPEGKFSIKDKYSVIFDNEEGHKVLVGMIAKVLKTMNPNADPEEFATSAKKMMGMMSIQRIASLAGDKVSQETLYEINCALNKIDKPQK